jgi:transitional endoplasmic reticulum ATPase
MLDLSENIPKSIIIDFGYARSWYQSTNSYNKKGLNFNYIASECFNNLYSPQSDVFSVGAIMYQLIFGLPPWFKESSKFQSERISAEEFMIQERMKTLSFINLSDDFIGFDEHIKLILLKALSNNPDDRFKNVKEFIEALNKDSDVVNITGINSVKSIPNRKEYESSSIVKKTGFSAIAGMKELKEQVKLDIIDALRNPQEYAKYGVTIPNGMLLYGPPGCGKTFFAKHFAQEVGFNFILATPSTLKSKYINATQQNISKMFKEAEKNAPIIIFIDEINELLPSRDSDIHEMYRESVNEMLAQMDRTGEKGIFIIGATNYPNMIDSAMLRTGRLDKKILSRLLILKQEKPCLKCTYRTAH